MKKASSFRKRMVIFLIFFNTMILAVSVLYAHQVVLAEQESGSVFLCFFKHNFLFYCPGCGGSRSLVFFLSLDILRSFIFYPPLPVAAAILFYFDIVAIRAAFLNSSSEMSKFKSNTLILIPVLILSTFVVRNILLIKFGIDPLGDISSLF